MNETTAVLVLVLTVGVLAVLLPFASHRTYLLLLSRRRRTEVRRPWPEDSLPRVTIQLPVFNERHVIDRLVDAACGQDYPAHLLEVQILDDSDDVTRWRAAQRAEAWRARGVDVKHIRRVRREGFKAGALAEGTRLASGEFLLVLDADFLPAPDLVRRLLPPFQDAGVGMVQARWDHLNRDESWLTQAQSLFLDGHFLFEQGGRYAGGRFFNFNGTAGMWRRSCMEDAGGWQADTLTEDLDLSYRGQMAGWRFVYLDDVAVPAEIPGTVGALEVQQRRWAQGGIQTARKVLPELLRGPWPLATKAEAVIHLCGHLAHPLTLMLALLLFPSAMARRALGLEGYLILDLAAFFAATVPFMAFYWATGRRRGRGRRGLVGGVARTLALGVGLSVPVTRAVLRGLRSRSDPFERTPKRGASLLSGYVHAAPALDLVGKVLMAGLMLAYLLMASRTGHWASIPFILLFLTGYGALALPGLRATLGEGLWRRHAGLPEIRPLHQQQNDDGEPQEEARPHGLRPVPRGLVGHEPDVAQEREPSHEQPRTAHA
jgi:cellulose synthase/poly-beta-1,6-N-acetylglucosamine synthase-like glycosyltransferase